MKKIALFLAAILLAGSGMASAQQNTLSAKQMKEITKDAKKQAKELARQGWQISGPVSMERAIEDALVRIANGAEPITGEVTGRRDIVVARTAARNAAINQYVETSQSMVKAHIETELGAVNEEDINNLVAGYERVAVKEIDGEFKHVYSLTRNVGGRYDVQSLFVVDPDAAAAARRRALKSAAEEADLINKYGDKIKDFINSGF